MLNHLVLPIVTGPGVYYLFLIVEVFLSLIVAVFVLVMMVDQFRAIRYDLTYVEYLKRYHVKTAEVGNAGIDFH